MKKIFLVVALFSAVVINAQKEEGTNKSFKTVIAVDGECDMCKTRIEKAVLKTKGVKYAYWDVESKKLSLIYNQRKTSLNKIQKSILNIGHDVGTVKAPTEIYNNLHECCHYRD